jgi:hypothetical protein
MTVLITLTTAGTDAGLFELYSDTDGYVSPFETGLSKSVLLAGYSSSLVPDLATIVRIKSDGNCTNFIDITIRPSFGEAILLGYNATVQALACSATPTVYYVTSACAVSFGLGCVVYTDSALTTVAPDGIYSYNGTYYYITLGDGEIVDQGPC